MAVNSAITGLTFPGIIDEPGCSAGRAISASPVFGPLERRRRSLVIRISSSARLRSAAETTLMARLHCITQVAGRLQRAATNLAQVLYDELLIFWMCIDSGSYS